MHYDPPKYFRTVWVVRLGVVQVFVVHVVLVAMVTIVIILRVLVVVWHLRGVGSGC